MNWEERLIKEHSELCDNIKKLYAVLENHPSNISDDISEKQYELMRQQYGIMCAYAHVLKLRITP